MLTMDDKKQCARCGEVLPLTDYHVTRAADGKLYAYCRACHREYQRVWRQKRRIQSRILDKMQITSADGPSFAAGAECAAGVASDMMVEQSASYNALVTRVCDALSTVNKMRMEAYAALDVSERLDPEGYEAAVMASPAYQAYDMVYNLVLKVLQDSYPGGDDE
jgi:hypothetical protein